MPAWFAKPASFEAWFKHAAALEAVGRRDQALTSYDRAIALKSDLAEAHANAGNILAALGRHEDAVTRYDRAIAARKDFVEVHINRGNSLRLLGRLEEAAAAYDAAVAIRPTMAQAHFSRGLAAEDCDRFAEAIESFDRAIALNPDVRLQAHALAHRSWAFNAMGDFERAFADVERSLRLAPNDDDALFRTSVIELLHGRWNEAWPKYERRLSCFRNGPRSWPRRVRVGRGRTWQAEPSCYAANKVWGTGSSSARSFLILPAEVCASPSGRIACSSRFCARVMAWRLPSPTPPRLHMTATCAGSRWRACRSS